VYSWPAAGLYTSRIWEGRTAFDPMPSCALSAQTPVPRSSKTQIGSINLRGEFDHDLCSRVITRFVGNEIPHEPFAVSESGCACFLPVSRIGSLVIATAGTSISTSCTSDL